METIKVVCRKCGTEHRVQHAMSLAGKRIKVKCKNEACRSEIPFLMPESLNQHEFTSVEKKGRDISEAWLEWCNEKSGVVKKFGLRRGIQIIGRESPTKKPDIAIQNSDLSLSRLHASINMFIDALGKWNYVIKDHQSKNGVYLNGRKLEEEDEIYLMPEDEIYLGKVKLIFKANYE